MIATAAIGTTTSTAVFPPPLSPDDDALEVPLTSEAGSVVDALAEELDVGLATGVIDAVLVRKMTIGDCVEPSLPVGVTVTVLATCWLDETMEVDVESGVVDVGATEVLDGEGDDVEDSVDDGTVMEDEEGVCGMMVLEEEEDEGVNDEAGTVVGTLLGGLLGVADVDGDVDTDGVDVGSDVGVDVGVGVGVVNTTVVGPVILDIVNCRSNVSFLACLYIAVLATEAHMPLDVHMKD